MDAVVVLPDHLHAIWTLPPGDTDFSMRWNLLKGHFSRAIETGERISASREKRRERGLWQRRFWEHLLRDQEDFNRHIDYIHWNPVKHGWAKQVSDWPYSSFHAYVTRGVYPENWGCDGQFGFGAEVAISTQKMHARGPMGLKELTTYKWIIFGSGQVRP